MPYVVHHTLLSNLIPVQVDSTGAGDALVVADAGSFSVSHPGVLQITALLAYTVRDSQPAGAPGRTAPGATSPTAAGAAGTAGMPGASSPVRTLPLALVIRTPDGQPFTNPQVTAADLARWRDRRGLTQGQWSYTLTGRSPRIRSAEPGSAMAVTRNLLAISVDESVVSHSAAPLVEAVVAGRGTQRFVVDLWRVGQLRAAVRSQTGVPNPLRPDRPWQGSLQLRDPAGSIVASSSRGSVQFEVTLATLGRSRGADGRVLPWTLEVTTTVPASTTTVVGAEVIATARLTASVLQSRINALLGANGEKWALQGDNRHGRAQARLTVQDDTSAELLDMHGLLDPLIAGNPQDPGIDTRHPDIRAQVPYTVADSAEDIGLGLRLIVNSLKLRSLNITLGPSQQLVPPGPALQVHATTVGQVLVRLGGFTLATATLRDNRIDAEVGLRIGAGGDIRANIWLPGSVVDIDIHWTAAVAAGVLTFGLLALGLVGLTEVLEREINLRLRDGVRRALDTAMQQAPRLFAVYVGTDVTYRAIRQDGNDMLFDHVAPLEPDPQPTPGYTGLAGRSVVDMGLGRWTVMPPRSANTWAADNLAKIDHIVVVMMENRSFDQVLGHLGKPGGLPGSDGLSKGVTDVLATVGFAPRPLRESSLLVKTQFPVAVGHHLADVQQQLAVRLTLPDGRVINSAQGFVENFAPKCAGHPQCVSQDVLGYYDGVDLPFYRHLTLHHAWSERYFCAHAGPTLPNRMFALTGEVQFDRNGEAIVDNNHADNFQLSRATTIFDVLTRRGVGWRVYESFPSVTMLRMFARYATDNTNIVPISRLAADVAAGKLPALTVIEPAMHHFPPNDDHPVADMAAGQAFLQQVYTTLASNPATWAKTLLLITYDEHGGFYDHVVPPLADLRQAAVPPTPPINGLMGGLTGGVTGALIGAPASGLAASATAAAAPAATMPAAKPAVLTPYGVRVPMFVVSPWVPVGKGPDLTLDHCAILKTVLARFCPVAPPFLSDRVAASPSFNAFLSASTPRLTTAAALTAPARSVAAARQPTQPLLQPMSRAKVRADGADFHDLTGLLARTLGRPV